MPTENTPKWYMGGIHRMQNMMQCKQRNSLCVVYRNPGMVDETLRLQFFVFFRLIPVFEHVHNIIDRDKEESNI